MLYRILADAVMVIHFAFLLFLALGGFVAWRYRWVMWPHAVAVGWGLLSVFAGVECPLTGWEDRLRRLAGERGLPGGFIDTYLTGVIYPTEHLVTMQVLVAALVVVSWAGLLVRRRRAISPGRR
ncbi:MAG TPA: DUF2784 domain-containing protein [Pseudonocardia sp.]|nr:DUF2784 domain-containing protein [Pseudonocardia sp.]